MPRNSKQKSKKQNNKRYPRKNRPTRSLARSPNIYYFKRETDELVNLVGTPDGWSSTGVALGKTFKFALNQIGDYSDFQNLFKYYRIKGARVRMYFSNTASDITSSTTTISPYAPNAQVMVMIDRNMDGATTPSDVNNYLVSQTKKRFVALQNSRKPSVDIYMPLKQADEVYADSGAPTALMNPKFLNTSDAQASQVPHYGYNINLERVDKSGFTAGMANNQKCRIITTLYIECKKVQ